MSEDTAKFESLVDGLSGWFDKPRSELPIEKVEFIKRISGERGLLGMWDTIDQEQRLYAAQLHDDQHDPAIEAEREFYWNVFWKRDKIQKKIEDIELMRIPSPTEQESKDRLLIDLNQQLAELDAKQQHSGGGSIINKKNPQGQSLGMMW